jgi:hypothetical protein
VANHSQAEDQNDHILEDFIVEEHPILFPPVALHQERLKTRPQPEQLPCQPSTQLNQPSNTCHYYPALTHRFVFHVTIAKIRKNEQNDILLVGRGTAQGRPIHPSSHEKIFNAKIRPLFFQIKETMQIQYYWQSLGSDAVTALAPKLKSTIPKIIQLSQIFQKHILSFAEFNQIFNSFQRYTELLQTFQIYSDLSQKFQKSIRFPNIFAPKPLQVPLEKFSRHPSIMCLIRISLESIKNTTQEIEIMLDGALEVLATESLTTCNDLRVLEVTVAEPANRTRKILGDLPLSWVEHDGQADVIVDKITGTRTHTMKPINSGTLLINSQSPLNIHPASIQGILKQTFRWPDAFILDVIPKTGDADKFSTNFAIQFRHEKHLVQASEATMIPVRGYRCRVLRPNQPPISPMMPRLIAHFPAPRAGFPQRPVDYQHVKEVVDNAFGKEMFFFLYYGVANRTALKVELTGKEDLDLAYKGGHKLFANRRYHLTISSLAEGNILRDREQARRRARADLEKKADREREPSPAVDHHNQVSSPARSGEMNQSLDGGFEHMKEIFMSDEDLAAKEGEANEMNEQNKRPRLDGNISDAQYYRPFHIFVKKFPELFLRFCYALPKLTRRQLRFQRRNSRRASLKYRIRRKRSLVGLVLNILKSTTAGTVYIRKKNGKKTALLRNSYQGNIEKTLQIAAQNAQSLRNNKAKYQQIESFLRDKHISILGLSETNCPEKNHLKNKWFNFSNIKDLYTIIEDNNIEPFQGTALLINKSLSRFIQKKFILPGRLTGVLLHRRNFKLLVLNVYMPSNPQAKKSYIGQPRSI